MKFKKKTKKVFKKYEGDRYIFKNGVAVVPDCWYKGKPMTVTLNEFNEIVGAL